MLLSLTLFVLGLLLSACPTVTLGSVGIKDGSVTAEGFTLTAEVVVEEVDDTEGEDATASEGRGILALELPAGWSVAAARIESPGEGVVRALTPVPQAAVSFAEIFPLEPGLWWTWATTNQTVAKGRWIHRVEFDIVFPKKTRGGDIGIAAGIFKEDMTELPAPHKYAAKLKGRKVVLAPLDPTIAPAPATAPADAPTDQPPAKGGNTVEDPNAKASGG
jgi:hypothetical protein